MPPCSTDSGSPSSLPPPLSGVIAVTNWAVIRGLLQPFGAWPRFVRRASDPLLRPIERRLLGAGGNPQHCTILAAARSSCSVVSRSRPQPLGRRHGPAASRIWDRRARWRCCGWSIDWTFQLLMAAMLVRVIGSWFGMGEYSLPHGCARSTRSPTGSSTRFAAHADHSGILDMSPMVAYLVLMVMQWAISVPHSLTAFRANGRRHQHRRPGAASRLPLAGGRSPWHRAADSRCRAASGWRGERGAPPLSRGGAGGAGRRRNPVGGKQQQEQGGAGRRHHSRGRRSISRRWAVTLYRKPQRPDTCHGGRVTTEVRGDLCLLRPRKIIAKTAPPGGRSGHRVFSCGVRMTLQVSFEFFPPRTPEMEETPLARHQAARAAGAPLRVGHLRSRREHARAHASHREADPGRDRRCFPRRT